MPIQPYGLTSGNILIDIPLFILLFGLTFIIVRRVVKIQDPVLSMAISAFSASLAYFIVRSQATLYEWFLDNTGSVFGLLILLIVIGIIFVVIKVL